jgi:hypothetical protein
MKTITLMVLFLLSIGAVLAAPVKITADGEGYGNHGDCYGWNDCGSAQGCALAACQANGFNTLVTYGDTLPCTELNNCNLFNDVNVSLIVQCDWGNSCEVMGVTDIWCDDGDWTGNCEAVLPDQSNPPGRGGSNNNLQTLVLIDDVQQIPEFGVVAAGIALIGALAIFAIRRKD